MPVTANQVYAELKQMFPAAAIEGATPAEIDQVLLDVSEIEAMLANGWTSVGPFLEKLESNLVARLPKSGFVFKHQLDVADAVKYADRYKERQAKKGGKSSDLSHLLTSELAEMEAKNGFHLLSDGKKVKVYLNVLPGDVFRKEAKEAMHFKDLVGPRHGEYTHRIQWYLATLLNRNKIQPMGKLFTSVNQVFAEVQPPAGNKYVQSLFQHAFDRVPHDYNTNVSSGQILADYGGDFRSPELFNDYLTSDLSLMKFPVLSSFLRNRKEKREGNGAGFNPFDYMSKKLYGKRYGELDPESDAFKEVNRIVNREPVHRYEKR